MDIVLLVVTGLLCLAILALAAGRDSLKQYENEYYEAVEMRVWGKLLGLISAFVMLYGFLAAVMLSDYSSSWLTVVAYVLCATCFTAIVLWWLQQRKVLVLSKSARARRIKANSIP